MKSNLFLKTKPGIVLLLLLAALACKQAKQKPLAALPVKTHFKIFSNNVKDSFYISVQLPLEYAQHPKKQYPVIVLTDANFFYPMLGPVLHQYEKGGLLPPLILAGIGYRSFLVMDSLRVWDYLYPKALPADEMKAVGGGQRFHRFITTELLPVIDTAYRVQKTTELY